MANESSVTPAPQATRAPTAPIIRTPEQIEALQRAQQEERIRNEENHNLNMLGRLSYRPHTITGVRMVQKGSDGAQGLVVTLTEEEGDEVAALIMELLEARVEPAAPVEEVPPTPAVEEKK